MMPISAPSSEARSLSGISIGQSPDELLDDAGFESAADFGFDSEADDDPPESDELDDELSPLVEVDEPDELDDFLFDDRLSVL